MKLYGFTMSPYTQRVLVAARLKGHELPVEPPPGGRLTSAEFAAISPMRRIPVLEAEDGWRLAESGAIVLYLDELLDGPALLPADPRERAQARMVTGLAETEIGAGLRHLMTQLVFRSCSDAGQLDYGRRQLALGFDALERVAIGRRGWAAGVAPGIADAALIPLLALARIIEDEFDGGKLMAGRPELKAYWARMKGTAIGKRTRDEMAAVVPLVKARAS